jgi:hypothetical protein
LAKTKKEIDERIKELRGRHAMLRESVARGQVETDEGVYGEARFDTRRPDQPRHLAELGTLASGRSTITETSCRQGRLTTSTVLSDPRSTSSGSAPAISPLWVIQPTAARSAS